MATITLEDMKFYAHHGCFEEERKVGTNFTVNLTFTYNAQKAAESDNIDDAINYAEVYNVIREEIAEPSHLIEHVALRIKKALSIKFPAMESISITLYKINPPLGGDIRRVGITL